MASTKSNYAPLVADLCNFIPWLLFQQCVVALDDDEACAGRYADSILDWIFGCMIKGWCTYAQVFFAICSDGCSLERLHELDASFCIKSEGSTASLECYICICKSRQNLASIVEPVLMSSEPLTLAAIATYHWHYGNIFDASRR